jgi:hypothetical protein
MEELYQYRNYFFHPLWQFDIIYNSFPGEISVYFILSSLWTSTRRRSTITSSRRCSGRRRVSPPHQNSNLSRSARLTGETVAILREIHTDGDYHDSDKLLKEENSLIVRFVLISARTGKPVQWWEIPEPRKDEDLNVEDSKQVNAESEEDALEKMVEAVLAMTIAMVQVENGDIRAGAEVLTVDTFREEGDQVIDDGAETVAVEKE